jgi:hypothetical protein
VTFRVARRKRKARPGSRVAVPPGVRHSFQNTGRDVAHLVAEMEPALDMQGLLEDTAALARAGKWRRVGRLAVPTGPRALLETADLMDRYSDTFLLSSPPPSLQRLLVPAAARLHRRRGR